MKVTPLAKYAEPPYPIRALLDEHPELLRIIPKRWQGNPVVLAALAGVCLLLAGSKGDAADQPMASPTSRVAPIFDHGNGVGGYGCVSVSPPVFLSEAEARKVIEDEAKRAGLTFRHDIATITNVRIPVSNAYTEPQDPSKDKPKMLTRIGDLKLDGMDRQRMIGYEVVSREDFQAWESKAKPGPELSVKSENYLLAAKTLRDGLEAGKARGTYGVFYGPWTVEKYRSLTDEERKTIDPAAEGRRRQAEARELVTENLRTQVRDFVKWLKAQGVI